MANSKLFSTCLMICALFLSFVEAASGQPILTVTAGPNPSGPSDPPIDVPWMPSPIPENPGSWKLEVDLIASAAAGPMEKHFESPRNAAGAPILLDALQPFPFVLWEDFNILPRGPGFAVTDWHERILEPGWEWVEPGDGRFPTLFPPGTSLITRNGEPWPLLPNPPIFEPTIVNAVFITPIGPGNVLDVHKALLWVGTPGNRIWGDNVDNLGAPYIESFIAVREFPTFIPEPAAIVMLAFGAIALLIVRRRSR